MHRTRLVPLGIVATLLLALVAVVAVPSALPTRIAAQADPNCANPVELVTNGSFEAPGVTDPPGRNSAYTPDGWTGSVDATTPAGATISDRTVDGNVYILNLLEGLSQTLPTSRYAGQSLSLSFVGNAAYLPTVTFGGQPVVYTGSGNGPYTATLVVPVDAGDLTLAFTRRTGELEAVSMIGCGATPTATATTEPTATATATTEPTATATMSVPTRPTATLRPTPRPRLNPTFTPVPSQPTVRPTARPRG